MMSKGDPKTTWKLIRSFALVTNWKIAYIIMDLWQSHAITEGKNLQYHLCDEDMIVWIQDDNGKFQIFLVQNITL
jgi:hypothetical protein